MGLVCQLECPECKAKVYVGTKVPQVLCPECKKGIIVNPKAKLGGKMTDRKMRHIFSSKDDAKISTCPNCKTQFTTPPSLFRGKVFCPSCHTEVQLEGVSQI